MNQNLPTPHGGPQPVDRWHGTQLYNPAPLANNVIPSMDELWERLPSGVKEHVVGTVGEMVTWWTHVAPHPNAVVALGNDAFVVGSRSQTTTGQPSFKMRVRRIVRSSQRVLPVRNFYGGSESDYEMDWPDLSDGYERDAGQPRWAVSSVLDPRFCDFIGNFPGYGQRAVQAPLLRSVENVRQDYSYRIWEKRAGESLMKVWSFVCSGDQLAVVVGRSTWPGHQRNLMSWSLTAHFAELAPLRRKAQSTSTNNVFTGKMTLDAAAAFLIRHGSTSKKPLSVEFLLSGSEQVVSAFYREAVKRLHPDAGGSTTLFQQLREAKSLLDAHFAE